MFRLYRAAWSTNVERVALALAHKGIAVESVVIEYTDRSVVEAASGQGLVPVIDDDGHVVSDSHAILRHLEQRWPDPPLFPAEPARRAEMDVFLDWFDRAWKGPPNEIEAELAEAAPDRLRIAELSEPGLLRRRLRGVPVSQVRARERERGHRGLPPGAGRAPVAGRAPTPGGVDRARGRAPARLRLRPRAGERPGAAPARP